MKNLIAFLISGIFLSAFGCKKGVGEQPVPGFYGQGYELPYQLNNPDTILFLKKSLKEISGLTYSDYSKELIAVNDEKGKIYYLNSKTGAIKKTTDFGKSDDYEGIASHGKNIFIAESNGNVKVVDQEIQKKTVEYDDILSRHHDIEGLTYNITSNTLLMAAKGNSQLDGNNRGEKSIFSMEISTGKIDKVPYLSINLIEEIKKLTKKHIVNGILVENNITSRLKDFGPSGIAVHPKTNDIYIISARGKLLVVVSPNKIIKAVLLLDQSDFVQPEGICFDSDGTLYISNEGRNRKGSICIYGAK